MARRAHDTVKEAECYQQIALIYERQDEMQSAIEYLNRFLEICIENKNQDQLGQAYKRLAECESKNGNTGMAIEYLGKVLDIANSSFNRQAQAEATLKLGLLFN